MGRRKRIAAVHSDTAAVDAAFRRLGLPVTAHLPAALAALTQALPEEVIIKFDNLEGDEAQRLAFMFSTPQRAMWFGVGLRAPMVRAQALWIVEQLRSASLPAGSSVVDVGSGAGVTASVVASALGLSVLGFDPQPGSAAASKWVAEQLAVKGVASSETGLTTGVREIAGPVGAVIAQAVLGYVQPIPCRSLSTNRGAFQAGQAHPEPATPDLLAVLTTGRDAGTLLVLDHDRPARWGALARHAQAMELAPVWDSVAAHSFELPLSPPGQPDRQISLRLSPGEWTVEDSERLLNVLMAGR